MNMMGWNPMMHGYGPMGPMGMMQPPTQPKAEKGESDDESFSRLLESDDEEHAIVNE